MNFSVYFKIAATTFPFIISILFGIRVTSVFACCSEFESKCCKWLLFCVVSYFSFISLLFKVPRFLRLPESLKAEMLWVSSCVQETDCLIRILDDWWWSFYCVNLLVLFNWRHCRPDLTPCCLYNMMQTSGQSCWSNLGRTVLTAHIFVNLLIDYCLFKANLKF